MYSFIHILVNYLILIDNNCNYHYLLITIYVVTIKEKKIYDN